MREPGLALPEVLADHDPTQERPQLGHQRAHGAGAEAGVAGEHQRPEEGRSVRHPNLDPDRGARPGVGGQRAAPLGKVLGRLGVEHQLRARHRRLGLALGRQRPGDRVEQQDGVPRPAPQLEQGRLGTAGRHGGEPALVRVGGQHAGWKLVRRPGLEDGLQLLLGCAVCDRRVELGQRLTELGSEVGKPGFDLLRAGGLGLCVSDARQGEHQDQARRDQRPPESSFSESSRRSSSRRSCRMRSSSRSISSSSRRSSVSRCRSSLACLSCSRIA